MGHRTCPCIQGGGSKPIARCLGIVYQKTGPHGAIDFRLGKLQPRNADLILLGACVKTGKMNLRRDHHFALWCPFTPPWLLFGSLLDPFGSLLPPFGSLWLTFWCPFGTPWLPIGFLLDLFGSLWPPFAHPWIPFSHLGTQVMLTSQYPGTGRLRRFRGTGRRFPRALEKRPQEA